MNAKRYEVIGPFATFAQGVLVLTPAQVKARCHALQVIGGNEDEGVLECQILQPVGFKMGEKVGFDGDASKVLLREISEVVTKEEAPAPAQAPAPKVDAKPAKATKKAKR